MITFDQLMLPLMKALVNLGGSGSIDEIYEDVVELEKFDEDTLAILHNPDKNSQREIGYRLSWARNHLKKAGFLKNSSRGIWAITDKARQAREIDSCEIVNYVRSLNRQASLNEPTQLPFWELNPRPKAPPNIEKPLG
ncbi:winged helix-turn-helix domain-containing protein [Pokkaliibacter sp. CJK22405]|uniref:winged helix-turn-helix domain-containing protein n=1 Tax=Pokkaliibacter sp. CJK22405 TaxID=3384615 RepID=UPI003984939D